MVVSAARPLITAQGYQPLTLTPALSYLLNTLTYTNTYTRPGLLYCVCVQMCVFFNGPGIKAVALLPQTSLRWTKVTWFKVCRDVLPQRSFTRAYVCCTWTFFLYVFWYRSEDLRQAVTVTMLVQFLLSSFPFDSAWCTAVNHEILLQLLGSVSKFVY